MAWRVLVACDWCGREEQVTDERAPASWKDVDEGLLCESCAKLREDAIEFARKGVLDNG